MSNTSSIASKPLSWILIANASRARNFARDADNGAMREICSFVHIPSRLKGTALQTDRGGQVRKSAASTQFAPHTDVHDKTHKEFAYQLGLYLEEAALAQRYPDLVVLASPDFLGKLRAQLGPATQRLLKIDIPLDLTTYQGAELEQRTTGALQQTRAEHPAQLHR